MTSTNATPVTIDVVSDVVCPWCFLGKRRLEAALADLPEIETIIRWRPYELDPSVPPEGVDRDEYIANRFTDPSGFDAAQKNLTELGQREGALYRFDRIQRTPNTIDAHRLIRWAGVIGREADAVEQLFTLYFVEGADVGNRDILANVGAAIGLDHDQTLARLASDEDRDAVRAEIVSSQRIGVTGVPTFILIGRYGVVGAQPKEVLVESIRRAAAEAETASEASA